MVGGFGILTIGFCGQSFYLDLGLRQAGKTIDVWTGSDAIDCRFICSLVRL